MGIAAWAYASDSFWLEDLIDTFKGTAHCRKAWEKDLEKKKGKSAKTDRQKSSKKFWR